MEDKILECLKSAFPKPLQTLEIAKRIDLQTKKEVNPILYELKKQGKADKCSESPPTWVFKEPKVDESEAESLSQTLGRLSLDSAASNSSFEDLPVTDPNGRCTSNQTGKVEKFSLPSDNKLTKEQTRYIWDDLAPSVCLITIAGVEKGTAFVVGKLKHESTGCYHHFVITNYHLKVKEAIDNNKQCRAFFGYVKFLTLPAVSVNVEPVVFAASEELDYIFICLQASAELDKYLSSGANLSSLITPDKPSIRDPLVIIGHPDGKELKVDFSSYCTQSPPSHPSSSIFYQSSIFHGGSGSPCFSVTQQKLYCMHSGGIINGPAKHVGRSSEVEYGVHLWEVINNINKQVMLQTFLPNISIKLTSELLYKIFPQIRH